MIPIIIASILLLLGTFHFIIKLGVWYETAKCPYGGGGAPSLDGIIFPPIFLAFGTNTLLKELFDIKLGYMAFLLWLLLTVLTVKAMTYMEKKGRQKLKEDEQNEN